MVKLRIIVDSLEQFEAKAGRDQPTIHHTRGDLVTPRDTQERDRWLQDGIAEDPGAEQKRAQEDLDRRQTALDAQRAALDAEAKAVKAEAKPPRSTG